LLLTLEAHKNNTITRTVGVSQDIDLVRQRLATFPMAKQVILLSVW